MRDAIRNTGAVSGSTYRCTGCRNGKHLYAWSHALIEGPVSAEGSLAEYHWIEDTRICEDSIQCRKHLDALIEKNVAGSWCRWWCCSRCDGSGRVCKDSRPAGYPCPDSGMKDGGGQLVHCGWIPLRTLRAA